MTSRANDAAPSPLRTQDSGLRTPSIDPITFEVLRNAFASIVDEMGAMLEKVAFSLVVSEGKDFSGSICTASGDLVSQGAFDLPAHIGTIPFTVKGSLAWLAREGVQLREGDIIITNDAYVGGTHNNDVRLILPVFWEGRIVAFVQNSAHWTDVGGQVPGTFNPRALSSHAEGLIIPPMLLVREGQIDRGLVNLILRNIRTPEVAYGDLIAQIEGVRLGERRLKELIGRYGIDLVLAEMEALIDYSERQLRAQFHAMPDGTYSWTAYIDRDPAGEDRPLKVHLDLTIQGDRAIYDFSQTDPQAKGAINGALSACISAAVGATKCVFPEVPMNQGIFNAITFVVPEGKLISARYPAPISGMAATVFPAVTDCVLGCYIQVVPERSMAGPVGLINVVIGGYDPRPGYERDYVTYLWLEGGWGARAARKDNHTAMCSFATSATNQPLELTERLFPVVFERYEYAADSAGAGYHRGGLGVRKNWMLSHGEAIFSDLGDGERFGPWGWAGGKDARPCYLRYAVGTPEEQPLSVFTSGFPIKSGRLIEYFQEGGGGYGDPLERPVEWVLEDVLDERVTVEGAARDYGVVIEVVSWERLDLRVDEAATAHLRAELRAARG